MTTATVQYVYARSRRGVWHRAVDAGNGLLTQERCNLDDAKRPAWQSTEPEATERRCRWCYAG
jgi:hypothetical protein